MKKLNERDIAQGYTGKPYDMEKLLSVSYQNGNNRYIADCCNYQEELLNLFGITPTLLEYWGYYGIKFSIFINVENNMVCSCGIDKYKGIGGYHGRPSVRVLTPTQQEIRIFRRLIDYITT